MRKLRNILIHPVAVAILLAVVSAASIAGMRPVKRESTLIKQYKSYDQFEKEAYSLIQFKGWKIQHLTSYGGSDDRNDRDVIAVYVKSE